MLSQLSKYASASAHLRELALEKRSGLIGGATKGLWGGIKQVGSAVDQAYKNWSGGVKGLPGIVARHPVGTLGVGMTAATGVPAAAGKTQQYKAGFDPRVQQAMMGQAPIPPG